MYKPYFRLFQDAVYEWRWTLHAGNGEAVATSEGYTSKASALSSIAKIRVLAPVAIIVE